jgi:carbon-monoxide dehydrogenase large subunit
MGGSAILDAAAKLKALVRAASARRFNCSADDVVLREGLLASYGERTISVEALEANQLASEGSFASTARTFCYGAAAAHVTVDQKTGHVQVVDYVTVEDLGRIINPLTAKGQAIGAAVQGLGGTFLEHLQYDQAGQFLTASLADYLMPTAADFPSVRAVDLQISPSPNNPLGAKGGGEGGIIPVGGVIAKPNDVL